MASRLPQSLSSSTFPWKRVRKLVAAFSLNSFENGPIKYNPHPREKRANDIKGAESVKSSEKIVKKSVDSPLKYLKTTPRATGEEKDVPNDSNVSIENFEVGEKVSTTEVLKTLTFGNGKSILDSSDNDSGRRLKALILDLESSPRESSETISSTLCGVAKAKSMLIQYISRRSYSKAVLFEKLMKKEVDVQDAEDAINELEKVGIINDTTYAEEFVRGRFNMLSWGPYRLKMELRKKGVLDKDIEVAIQKVFQSEDEELEKHGMSASAWEKLTLDAKKIWKQGSKLKDSYAQKRKLAGWLQRRGFGWDIVEELFCEFNRSSEED